jgi:hypothetical protein
MLPKGHAQPSRCKTYGYLLSLPITIFRVPEEIDRLKYCEEIGIDRVVFSLPAEGKDKLMPIIDRWAELKHRMGG